MEVFKTAEQTKSLSEMILFVISYQVINRKTPDKSYLPGVFSSLKAL